MAYVNKLVFAILKFLEDQKTSIQHDEEALESLEVAVQCLEQVFKMNTTNEEFVRKYSTSKNLLDVFATYLNQEEPNAVPSSVREATREQKDEAERLKNKGNEYMKLEKYSDAQECYSQAIRLDSRNAVYFCNRAAAYSKMNRHQEAIEDCSRALAIDPSYSKAYGRMGIAFTALENHEHACECYRKALELDPENQSYKSNLEIAEQQMKAKAAQAGFNAGPGGGFPGLGGLGGLDFRALMSDPNLVNMAASLMSNPQIQQAMSGFMGGANQGAGGLGSLLQASQQMASQLQQSNPELIQQLRQHMTGQNQSGNNTSDENRSQGSSPP